jgi:MscS family membrane protein
VLLRILNIIEGHGAEVAFPTRTVHLAPMPEPIAAQPVADPKRRVARSAAGA